MKKVYEKPIIEIEEFEVEDIATLTSSNYGTDENMLIDWNNM